MDVTAKTYSVGTLTYTKMGLFILFGWLLWGDFCFMLMQIVEPAILPLILKSHNATNQQIVFITGSIIMVLNCFMNPLISYNSDRYRSKWGRRRPFIIITAPFVLLFLALIPFAPEILKFLSEFQIYRTATAFIPIPPVIIIFGVLVVLYQIFNLFVASVYYYLIPDVVPNQFIGRFYSLFRIVGVAAGAVFNYFIFPMAETHTKEIFIGIALIYGVAIALMCWKVQEGEYPPPSVEKHGNFLLAARNYFKESFGHGYYWYMFLCSGALAVSSCVSVFYIFLYKQQYGLDLKQVGEINVWLCLASFLLYYPFGILIDRWGSLRSLAAGLAASSFLNIASYFFMHEGYWSVLIWRGAVQISVTLIGVAIAKATIDVYPRERYGQFCSAGAITASALIVVFNVLAGWIGDELKTYGYILIWAGIAQGVSAVLAFTLYGKWLVHGAHETFKQEDLEKNAPDSSIPEVKSGDGQGEFEFVK